MTTEDVNLALKWSSGEVSRADHQSFVTVTVATITV